MKYHEVQKTKLEDLQKTIDALTLEKEALIAELSGWRECLDAPEQAVPAEILETNVAQGNMNHIGSHDLNVVYDGATVSGPTSSLEMPAMVPATYDMLAGPVSNPIPDAQLLDDYSFPTLGVSLDPSLNVMRRTSHHPAQNGAPGEPPHALWSAQHSTNMQQPLWTQPSYQEVPFDFQRQQYQGQGYNIRTG